jgi:DNA helicase-2/ATP-dependent DNA helicase PcrA
LQGPDDEEEERRLFYVGITRARNELYLSYPLTRAIRGGSGDIGQVPSRFLKDIPGALINELQLRPYFAY